MARQYFTILVFIVASSTACRNHYNETIQWTENIKRGTHVETVKRNQPEFVEIIWNKPDTLNNQILYEITEIKGSKDILKMRHFLLFIDNKYEGRRSTK